MGCLDVCVYVRVWRCEQRGCCNCIQGGQSKQSTSMTTAALHGEGGAAAGACGAWQCGHRARAPIRAQNQRAWGRPSCCLAPPGSSTTPGPIEGELSGGRPAIHAQQLALDIPGHRMGTGRLQRRRPLVWIQEAVSQGSASCLIAAPRTARPPPIDRPSSPLHDHRTLLRHFS